MMDQLNLRNQIAPVFLSYPSILRLALHHPLTRPSSHHQLLLPNQCWLLTLCKKEYWHELNKDLLLFIIIIISMDIKKAALFGVGAIGLLVAGLFVKNVISESKAKPLTKDEIVRILRIYRKERYVLFKQVATFAINISQQMRGNINQQAIEQFINGPECPFKFKEESETILATICEQNGISADEFETSLEKFSKEADVAQLLNQQELDYRTSLGGKLPHFDVKIPATLTKDVFYKLQNQITKRTYIQQVRVFQKLQKHSEIELQQDPSILKELGNPDADNEEMLRKEGYDTEFVPAMAVYESAILSFKKDGDFQNKIRQIETGYQTILMRYMQRIQSRSITDGELNQMQQEFIYFQPL